MSGHVARLAPSALLIVLAGTIAAAVNHLTPADGRRLLEWSEGPGSPVIRTGSLDYPRTAVDSGGYVVRVARPARRIASQYWAIDEYVYSIVPPQHVVAVSESAYLKSVSNVYQYVERFHPAIASDPERVLRLDADLLMVADSSRPDFCAIVRDAQIPIYRAFTTFTTLRQIAETIRVTGYLTGEEAAATEAVKRFWTAIEAAKARRRPGAPRPRILGFGGQSTYGRSTLFDDIVRTLGGVNVGAAGGLQGYAEVSSEQIARWNPEWIVTGSAPGKARETLAAMLADPGIALTQAAQSGHILVLENHVFLPMSPFTTLLVTAMAEALYG